MLNKLEVCHVDATVNHERIEQSHRGTSNDENSFTDDLNHGERATCSKVRCNK